MRKLRLYTPKLANGPDCEIPLSEAMQHRLTTVLRVSEGTEIECFDGQGHWQTAVLSSLKAECDTGEVSTKKRSKKSKKTGFTANALTKPTQSAPPLLSVSYGIALIKGERFEWALQKMTELGVSQITPLICQHGEVKLNSERLDKKMNQWQAILIAAAEQCHLNWLPTLNDPMTFTDWCAQTGEANSKNITQKKWILSPVPQGIAPLAATMAPSNDPQPTQLIICSGPEGGFSPDELASAQAAQFEALTLGPRILRAETAPIAALTLAHWLWGDFGPNAA